MPSITSPKSAEQVKAEFHRKGVSIRAWAKANKFSPTLVYNILNGGGKNKCTRGESHKIAVRLGLKHGEITQSIRNAI